jgi:hypothetical protein
MPTMQDKRVVYLADSSHYRSNARNLGLDERASLREIYSALQVGQEWEDFARWGKRTLIVKAKCRCAGDPRIDLEDKDTGRKTTKLLRGLMVGGLFT